MIPHIAIIVAMIIGIMNIKLGMIKYHIVFIYFISFLGFIDKYNFITKLGELKQVVEIFTGQSDVLCKLYI